MSQIVLVHGAWGGAWIWRDVLPLLRAAGHRVHAVTLTGDGERAHLRNAGITLRTHIADVVGLIEAEELADVALVGHSYGGQVITQYGGTLSGGEQQMLAIGRGLMLNPRILMLDEPSMGLAPVLVDLIFDTIKKLNEQGTTILLVEQNALMALSIAHRGYVLQTGSIALTDDAAKLKQNEMVQKTYLGIE